MKVDDSGSSPKRLAAAERAAVPALTTPPEVAATYLIPESTQAVWRSTNRHGFARLVVKIGRSVRYDRGELEAWIRSRRMYGQEAA
jgi:predicted DNA-binding transcriptional regulator AlpA